MPRGIYITKKKLQKEGKHKATTFDATLNLNLSIQFQYINGAVQTEEREARGAHKLYNFGQVYNCKQQSELGFG